jgi:hypothetical protein
MLAASAAIPMSLIIYNLLLGALGTEGAAIEFLKPVSTVRGEELITAARSVLGPMARVVGALSPRGLSRRVVPNATGESGG